MPKRKTKKPVFPKTLYVSHDKDNDYLYCDSMESDISLHSGLEGRAVAIYVLKSLKTLKVTATLEDA